MILSPRIAAVKVSSPEFNTEEWNVWRGNRSNEQLKIEYQVYIYQKYAEFVPIRAIQIGSDYDTAA